MMAKTPEQELAERQARLAISQQYLSRDDNPDLDPSRQDQLDKNRVPGQFGLEQLSPLSAQGRGHHQADQSGNDAARFLRSGEVAASLRKSLDDQPYATLSIAILLGFAMGAIWKS